MIEREGNIHTDRSSFCWFTPKIYIRARLGHTEAWSPGFHPVLPCEYRGQRTEAVLHFLPEHTSKELDQKYNNQDELAPVWDAGITGTICCATALAPQLTILNGLN